GFSLLYLLSNALYLPQRVIDAVRHAGVPLVLNQNGVFYPAWYPVGWQRENQRVADVHAVANHVLYQSEFCRQCADRFLGTRDGSSEILYNAVDTEHFRPAGAPGGPRPFTFLVTGTIGRWTDYRLISSIEGLAAARNGGLDVRLTIAGAIDRDVEAQARSLAERPGGAEALSFPRPHALSEAPAVHQTG